MGKLLVCHQMYQEAALLPFPFNVFNCKNKRALENPCNTLLVVFNALTSISQLYTNYEHILSILMYWRGAMT
jgi:hypothetical protein